MYEVQRDIPVPDARQRGFTNVLRSMRRGESVEIPQGKRPGAYAAARLANVKITIRATDAGTLRVWRVDGPATDPGPVAPRFNHAQAYAGNDPRVAEIKAAVAKEAKSKSTAAAAPKSIFDDGLDIFGQPLKPKG
jgi:hypothetical protein